MEPPTEDTFRALARSSPWRWSTVVLTWTGAGVQADDPHRERAWLRRPDDLRLEDLSGQHPARVERRDVGQGRATLTRWGTHPGGDRGPAPWERWPSPADATWRDDRLVATRPDRYAVDTDAPFNGSYRWTALLDPVELADPHVDEPGGPATTVVDLAAITHHGRAAWSAVLLPATGYDPRCPCCALLPHPDVGLPLPDGMSLPVPTWVVLDLGTGICVRTEVLEGVRAGWGHDVAIEAVDVRLDDELFARPRGRRR